MKESAGLVLLHDNKILLVHPTGGKWFGTYSIPKGEIDENETALEAAIRETHEEIGILFDIDNIRVIDDGYINYTNGGETYKRVYFFVVNLIHLPIGIQVQKEEVDWAGWLPKAEAEKRIFWRLKPVLQYLK